MRRVPALLSSLELYVFCASQSHPVRGQLQGSAVNFVVQTANLSFSRPLFLMHVSCCKLYW